jgi:hypothetical protein
LVSGSNISGNCLFIPYFLSKNAGDFFCGKYKSCFSVRLLFEECVVIERQTVGVILMVRRRKGWKTKRPLMDND